MANEIISKYKDPSNKIPLKIPELYVIELYDKLTITCTDVGLNSYSGRVERVRYHYGPDGLYTKIGLESKGFNMADIIATHERKLAGEV